MKNHLLILILFLLICVAGNSQKSDPDYLKAEKCVQEYMHFSRLGPGYSRDISTETMDQFIALFEEDAFLYWDLYKSATDSLFPPLPIGEYIERARKSYFPKQPLLDYPDVKINVLKDGKFATAYLEKINLIMDDKDNLSHRNTIRLRLNINMHSDKPLIQNIVEDDHGAFVRSISVGGNFILWSNVYDALSNNPVVLLGLNEHCRQFTMIPGSVFQRGAMVEMRLNRVIGEGLLFSTGILYSKTHLASYMADYVKSFADTLDKNSASPFTCTTFERSSSVQEKMTITKIEIPFLLKSYITNWMYLKFGTALGYVFGKSDVYYVLNRTGGGWVTDLNTGNQHYLDPGQELDQAKYGYYLNGIFHFPKEKFLNKMVLSIQVAPGFEKQLNYFSFGFEPNFSFGMNNLRTGSSPGNYPLASVESFNPVLGVVRMPAFECAFGIRLWISYVFKD